MAGAKPQLVFFDVETTIPGAGDHGEYDIIEFGAIVLDGATLVEVSRFETLIRSWRVTDRSFAANHISAEMLATAPLWETVAPTIRDILHGRVWVGHNVAAFDCRRVAEQFLRTPWVPAPAPAAVVDTLPLLRHAFGRERAGNLKLATLTRFFGLGEEPHRALEDSRLCFEVLLRAALLAMLERYYPPFAPLPAQQPSDADEDELSSRLAQAQL